MPLIINFIGRNIGHITYRLSNFTQSTTRTSTTYFLVALHLNAHWGKRQEILIRINYQEL